MREIDTRKEDVFQSLYDILRPLTSQPECATCRSCEEHVGLVYLLGNEAVRARNHGVPVSISLKGTQYITRMPDGCCAAFNPATNSCRIYAERPLCCRLYPLDLMNLDGIVWWVIHAECPIARRFQRDRHMEKLAAMTAALERELSEEQLRAWLRTDDASQSIEAFSSSQPVVFKLRRYGGAIGFP